MGGVYLGMLPGRLALVAQNSSGRWRCQQNSGSSFSNATSKHIHDFWEQSPPKKRYSLITWPCPAQTDNIAQHHSEHKTASALLEAEFTETPGLSYHFKKKKEIERTFSQWTSYKSVPVYTGHSVSQLWAAAHWYTQVRSLHHLSSYLFNTSEIRFISNLNTGHSTEP